MEQNIHQQIATMRQSFFDEGILDENFVQVESLSTPNDPHFLEKVLTTYFRDSNDRISFLENALMSPQCKPKAVEVTIYKLKGASSSIGAKKLCKEIDLAINACREDNLARLKNAVEQVQIEYMVLRSKLEPYFQMMRQAGPSESAVRPR